MMKIEFSIEMDHEYTDARRDNQAKVRMLMKMVGIEEAPVTTQEFEEFVEKNKKQISKILGVIYFDDENPNQGKSYSEIHND